MSNPITYSKSVTLAFCFALLGFCSSFATAQDIQWHEGLEQARAEAAKTNRLVWLHFSAEWCSPCKRLETFVFKNPGVIRTADRNTVAIKVDVDEDDSLVKKLGVPRIPYDIVMTPGGEMLVNRPSPRDSSGYLKMFNDLDIPLQNLNSGDRETINAGISQLQSLIKKAGGAPKAKGGVDLDGPSHRMAATTVEGQRIERGMRSVDRAAELRAIEAKVLKGKAETFIAQQEQRLSVSQGPKISNNPFFKQPGEQATPAIPYKHNEFVSNQFLASQDKPAQVNSLDDSERVLPPTPPTFTDKVANQIQRKATKASNQFEGGQEFNFPSLTDTAEMSLPAKRDQAASEKAEPKSALPTFAAPQLAGVKKSLPELPKFSDGSGSKDGSNDFGYAPLGDLKKALSVSKQPGVANPERPVAKQSAKPSVKVKPAVAVMKPEPAVPKAPVMIEGFVRTAKAEVPVIEGYFVSEKQTRNNTDNVAFPRQPSRGARLNADRMLDQVNFFAPVEPANQATKATIIKAAPAPPQPQIVINLNTGSSSTPQPTQIRNSGQFVNRAAANPVTQASSSQGVDPGSVVKSKYALKGKCPVTLLTQGRWVDGQKEIGCVHRDRVYLFASAANREAFLANPDQMSPLLAGFDPVIFEETGKLVEGDERHGTFMGEVPNQRIVLFKTSDTRDRFQKQPVKYLNVVRNAMTKNATSSTKLR